jgi:hypothetical protein
VVILLDQILHIIETALPVLFISGVFVYTAVQVIKIGLGGVKYAEKETRINALLEGALARTDGERVSVVKFFGPNKSLNKIPYNFMSCRYEAAKPGKQPASEIMGRVPVPLYIKFLQNLMNGYVVLDPRYPNCTASEVGYDLVAAQGESKGLYLPLKDFYARPIGYLSLCKDGDFAQCDLDAITKLSSDLMPLINGWDDKRAKTGILYFLIPRTQLR